MIDAQARILAYVERLTSFFAIAANYLRGCPGAPPLRLSAAQLPQALARGLAGFYLVSGDEPLLIAEALDAIRMAGREAGYAERKVLFIDRFFDWSELRVAAQSLSLFSERRLFELRMPTGKPDKGAALLAEMAAKPPPDTLFVVVTGKLDGKTWDAAWIRAVEQHGVALRIWPVEAAALPAWLRARAAALRLILDDDAAELIVQRVEGNLLAAKQELDKLALLADGERIDIKLVLNAVGNSARYDVFQLATAAAAGEAPRALRILLGLRGEGVEPTLILWAMVRELRGLWQSRERNRLRSQVRAGGWNQAANPSAAALARMGKIPLARLLRQAHHVDRVIKGLAAGDPWTALTGLVAALSGALQAPLDSGRVSA